MKNQTNFRLIPTFGTFLTAAGLFVTSQTIAQEYALLTSPAPTPTTASAKPKEPTRAYWKMTTNSGADSTTVSFYKPDNTLVYEEKLPSPAVKLTKRTQQTLTEVTDRLTEPNAIFTANNVVAEALAGRLAPKAGQVQLGTYASKDGIHLNLMLDNPAQKFLFITLLNQQNQTVYESWTREAKPRFKLNMEGMPAGNYHLRVMGNKQHFDRELTFSYPQPDPQLPKMQIAIK